MSQLFQYCQHFCSMQYLPRQSERKKEMKKTLTLEECECSGTMPNDDIMASSALCCSSLSLSVPPRPRAHHEGRGGGRSGRRVEGRSTGGELAMPVISLWPNGSNLTYLGRVNTHGNIMCIYLTIYSNFLISLWQCLRS